MVNFYIFNRIRREGLVSAAKQVATSTQDLCEAANKVAKGGNRDLVIVAARSVSASTARLLTAAKVKGDVNSMSQVRLKSAGNAVTNATSQMVKLSGDSQRISKTDGVVWTDSTIAGKVMEMEAQVYL
jgi:talin